MVPGIQHDTDGFPYLDLRAAGHQGRIYQHGAHLTAFGPEDGEPVLFLSSQSRFESGKAIRGGVPIIAPWFGDHPTARDAPAHGLVRTRAWEWVGHTATPDQMTAALKTVIKPGPWFDGQLDLAFTAEVSQSLSLSLSLLNTGSIPVRCEVAFHPYFVVGDSRQIRVTGLQGAFYLDKTRGFARTEETADAIQITEETDRLYLDTPAVCSIEDPVLGRRIILEKTGSSNTIVWNPWVKRSQQLADFGDDEWTRMICVEQACAADNALVLPPGESRIMTATYRVEPLD